MSTEFTTWACVTAGYDEEFRRQLTGEIISAIAKASMVTDARVMAIRRIRRQVPKNRAEGFCQDFIFGARRGGRA